MIKVNITKDIEEHFVKLIDNIFKDGKLVKRKDKKTVFSVTKRDIDRLLLKKLRKFDENINFEKLILSGKEYIDSLIGFIDFNKEFTKLSKKEKDYFFTLYARFNKPSFIKKLGVSTCLYCNRNYIFNFTKSNKENATAQLDHFYDKSTYPYLAVCLYNLIPSCTTCNQRKSSKKIDILHPYYESFDKKAKFSLKIEDCKFYHSLDGFNIEIKTEDKKVENSKKVFNLEQLYENHKDIVLELIQKEAIYNESYLDELLTKYEGTLFKNREDLQRLISGGYVSDDEIGKRPLSKLVKDISSELGLF